MAIHARGLQKVPGNEKKVRTVKCPAPVPGTGPGSAAGDGRASGVGLAQAEATFGGLIQALFHALLVGLQLLAGRLGQIVTGGVCELLRRIVISDIKDLPFPRWS